MSPFVLIFRSIIMALTRHGRIADLMLGFLMIGIGVHFSNPWIVASGGLAFLTYSINLNGMVQRFTMNRVMALAAIHRR